MVKQSFLTLWIELLSQLLDLGGSAVAVDSAVLGRFDIGCRQGRFLDDLFDRGPQGLRDGHNPWSGRDILILLVAGKRALKDPRRLCELDLS